MDDVDGMPAHATSPHPRLPPTAVHPIRASLHTSRTRAANVVAPTAQQVADDGDFVEVHYTGTLDDGTVFDSSRDREPLSFVVSAGTVVPGFDIAVKGLAVGGTRTQRVEPADAYGSALGSGLPTTIFTPQHSHNRDAS